MVHHLSPASTWTWIVVTAGLCGGTHPNTGLRGNRGTQVTWLVKRGRLPDLAAHRAIEENTDGCNWHEIAWKEFTKQALPDCFAIWRSYFLQVYRIHYMMQEREHFWTVLEMFWNVFKQTEGMWVRDGQKTLKGNGQGELGRNKCQKIEDKRLN